MSGRAHTQTQTFNHTHTNDASLPSGEECRLACLTCFRLAMLLALFLTFRLDFFLLSSRRETKKPPAYQR